MNIVPSKEFMSLDRVELSSIPSDFFMQVDCGAVSILGVKIENGTLHHDGVIFPPTKFADLVFLDEENKSIIIRL